VVSEWFNANHIGGWLTCPLTQNGCVRVLSQPKYPGAIDIAAAHNRLRTAVSAPEHQFIGDDVSILDGTLVEVSQLSGHRQLTDVYLLALAVAHDASLVTLDTRIPMAAVRGATDEHLVAI
jgi:toxin-antitoxin system PIN domain toxin